MYIKPVKINTTYAAVKYHSPSLLKEKENNCAASRCLCLGLKSRT